MMKTRRFFCYFEPFSLSFYGSRDRVSDRFAHLEPQPEHDYNVVIKRITKTSQQQAVFIKDMASHVIHKADDAFLSNFKNTFIMRHPAKMLPSLLERWPIFKLEETGWPSLHKLFNRVKKIHGEPPVIIDSDDLIKNPNATIKAYCNAVGIPFIPEALTWKIDVEKTRIGHWNDGDAWFTYLKSTTGFQEKINNNYESVEENKQLKFMYNACLPYYEELYQQRLIVYKECTTL